ncbi:ribonuclease T2 family [Shinella sp. DD12]|uniref:ribonuclease T2 family n=1 Tax=Shinella sp. DD12 TaxID=1410620 RepID=UPI000437B1E3|nr:ribonuclease T2 family [Shinella sp. DD12]EYR77720.1 ribonuclease, T2 family [Shinella sp. DD12]
MMTNAALTFKAALSLLAACLLFLASPAAAQTVPASREGREVLSVSWQKGYCAARPRSRGCADFSANAPAARQFSLLSRFQVRKSYCGIEAALKQRARKGKWTELPDIVLASVTKERLMAAMPAARLGLDRQQWLRSGSCVAVSPEIYYSRSLDLLDTLNASPVRALFSQKAGAAVTLAEVRAAFDAAFGKGAGERVVTGLTIGLAGDGPTLAERIAAAVPTKSRCTEGVTGPGQAG